MSQRNSGETRQKLDQYMTPAWVVEALLKKEHIAGRAWEPACGTGNIVKALKAAGVEVMGTDIDPGFGTTVSDFLEAQSHYGTIITNPPYGAQGDMAVQFVRTALHITEAAEGKVIMLLPMAWDAASGRQDILEDFPGFVAKYALTRRIRWENLPQKKAGPTMNHAWFVWDWFRRGRDIGWVS